jgi:hypothetical protein
MLPEETSAVLTGQTNVTPRDPSAQLVQAGYTSLMAEGSPTGQAYFDVLQENEEVGYSPTTQSINTVLHQEETQRMTDMLPDILLDDSLTDDQKREMLGVTAGNRPENSLTYQYARDELETPEYLENNAEYRDSKQAGMDIMLNVSEYYEALDAAQDQLDLDKDPGFTDQATDFLHMMIPFVDQATVADVNSLMGKGPAGVAEAFILLGESKEALVAGWEKMPIGERRASAESLVNILLAANSNSFTTNELNTRAMIDTVMYGDYADWERWLDNAVGLLDLSLLGKPVKWGVDAVKMTNRLRKVRSVVRHSSPHRMANESNATTARNQVAAMMKDETGEVSQALTGASRGEGVLDTVFPEMKSAGSDSIRNKVGESTSAYEKTLVANKGLEEALNDSAIGALTKKEIEAATARVVNNLQEAKGVTSRKEMFTIEAGELGARIKGVYGPAEGGWSSAKEARELLAVALRSEGVTANDIVILKRMGNGEYKPVIQAGEEIPVVTDIVTGIQKEEKAEYLAALDFDYETRFSDIIGDWTKFDVKRNFLDRSPIASKLGVQRHLIDPASTLDPHIIFGANAAVDKAARATKVMLEDAKVFSDQLKNMDKDAQQLTLSYLKEANEQGLKFNRDMVKADYNFTDKQLDAIQSFRNYWDDVWAIRNRTDAKAMVDEGYVLYESAATDTRLFGRPRSSVHLDKSKPIYNPETDGVSDFYSAEKALNDGLVEVIQLRRPLEVSGSVTDYVLVAPKSTRRMTKDDIVYPYRDGYFEVNYTQPHFIVREITDSSGKVYTKAVATAETFEDAELYISRLAKTDPDGVYVRRGDIKDRKDLAGFEQDMFESYGHGRQRARGQRLEDATAVVRNTEQNNVKGPVDTMIDTSRLMGNRIAMTDYMNATKQRFMETYAEVLPTKLGQTQFPARLEDIGSAANAESSFVADARTTFEYIAYLEHGYISSLSEVTKSAMRTAADAFGARGFGTLEKVARATSEASIVDTTKNAAFQLYIALNPLRQLLLNAHQSALLLANFPQYAINPRGMVADFTAMADLALSGGKNLKVLAKASARSEDELRLMYKEFQKSGLEASIDVHNMARGTLTEFAEGTRFSQSFSKRAVGAALGIPRKVGFEAGEWVNLTSAWLAQYDKAKQGKAALTRTDFHEVGAKARNYTFNMNRAGDMPYNQNVFSLLFQFFQVPHKAALQLTNRALAPKERVKLGLYNALSYSLPVGAMYTLFGDMLPDPVEHPEIHDAVVQGLEFYMWNRMIEGMTGLESEIDFSSMSPSDPYGVYEVIHGLFTTETGSLIAASPAGSLFFGNNPRITNLAKTAARFFNVTDDFEGDPTTMSHVFNDMAHLTSGYSNYYKAKMAYDYGKLYSQRGEVVDPSVSSPEAIALAFGFPTMDAAREYTTNNRLYKTKEAARKDVDKFFNEYTTRLSREGITAEEVDYQVKLMSQAMRVFKDNPAAMDRVTFRLKRSLERGDTSIYNAVLRLAGEMPPEKARELMRGVPNYDPEKKKMLIDTIDLINSYKEDNK